MRINSKRPFAVARFVAALILACGAASADEIWVELGPAADGAHGYTTLARFAAHTGARCPAIVLDGKPRAMDRRASTGTFSALVCEALVPEGTRTASIRHENLPLPKWGKNDKPNVVVIGDTGCRIKKGGDEGAAAADAKWNIQKCNVPADWPFEQVASNAAAAHPDLVIHVGDYLYREKNCDGVKNCPGGPAGDMMATWEADFFTPARKLLRAAPWVFVRGNHETCDRAGDGWFSLLDPRTVSSCQEFMPPYLVQAGALRLAVVDDSTASDAACAPGEAKCATQFAREVEEYTRQFQTISSWGVDHSWLLSHRPVWSVKRGDAGAQVLNAALEAAWAKQRPSGVELLLAGHTHVFEAIGFARESGHATQLVVGNSGTKLAQLLKFDPKDSEVVHAQIREFQKIQDFGFTTLQPEGDSWRAEAHDRDGKVHVRCSVPMSPGRCADEGK